MKRTNIIFSTFFLSLLVIVACKKDEDTLYQINPVTVYPQGTLYSNEGDFDTDNLTGVYSGKGKLKTHEQYIAVLYSNIFRRGITVNELNDARDALYSLGDKQLGYEILVVNYLERPDAIIPSDDFMRQYPDSFLTEVYNRYFVREISEAERTWMRNYIEDNRDEVGVEEVIAAVALSNEFKIY